MPRITGTSTAAHRAATRDRIMRAVGQLMTTQGVEGVSVSQVAATAGLTRTVIYNYYPDRASLLLAYTQQEVARFLDHYQAEAAEVTSAAERVALYVRLQLADYAAHPQPAAHELAGSLNPRAYEQLRAHVAPLGTLLTEVIAGGVAVGEFAECDPAATAGLVHACLGAERIPLARGEHNLDQAVATVTTFVLRALGSGPAPSSPSQG